MLAERKVYTTTNKLQSEIIEQLCKNTMDVKNWGSKVFGSRLFSSSNNLWNNCNTIVMTGMSMKPPNDINYVLVECNYFLKPPRQIIGILIMIYIQEHLSDSK